MHTKYFESAINVWYQVVFLFFSFFSIFVGRQLCWKDHLVFSCNAVCDACMYVTINWYVRSRQHQKGKSSLSNENAMTNFHQTWYVGSGGHKYYLRGLSSPNAHI